MRALGVDFGSVRIGLALSDELGVIAQPLETVAAEPAEAALARIAAIVREREVGRIIVGMPRNMDGSFGPAAAKTEQFIAALRAAVTVPVQSWDERLTSAQAQRSLIAAGVRRNQRKEKVDRTAAAILLQSYLDRESEADHRL